MKLAYVTTYDARSVTTFGGGTGHYMARSLEDQSVSLEYVGPLVDRAPFLYRSKELYYRRLRKKWYTRNRDRVVVKDYARQISRKLSGLGVDVVFSPQSPGSQPIAYLECEQPIVIWTDATLAGVIGFYPRFSNMCEESLRDGMAQERLALERCKLAIYSSDWAAQTAVDNYQVDPSKVKVVPYGPNLDCDLTLEDVKSVVQGRPSDKCKLLFIGVEWRRKGANTAIAIAKHLNESGLATELTIIGGRASLRTPLPYVRTLGHVDKDDEQGLDLMRRSLAESHFLILPTRADCTPMVIAEACSSGVPCITTDVGGIRTLIKDDVNGKAFAKDAGVEEYCSYISEVFYDRLCYETLALSSFNEYQVRLNWNVAGKAVKQLLTELVG